MSGGCRYDEDEPEAGLALVEPLGVDGNGLLTERMRLGELEVVVHRDDVPETDVTTVRGIPLARLTWPAAAAPKRCAGCSNHRGRDAPLSWRPA